VILGAVLLFAGGDLRARQEEAVLIARFGDEYREYMGRVNRAIPGIY
jgi:protein-S-isoprenylcysteine O-methyltransferase Ste14